MRWLNGITDSMDMSLSGRQGSLECCSLWGPKELEKAMAPNSSTLAWKIPWMEGPSGLQSMGSLGVGHD